MEVSDVSPALQQRLGVDATAGLLELFETARRDWTVAVTTEAVDRFERRLSEEVGRLRDEMQGLAATLRVEMRELSTALRAEMRDLSTSVRAETQVVATTLRAEMREGDSALRLEMREGFATLRQENTEARFELMKWCFVFWVGQFFAVAGLLAVVVRFLRP